MNETDIHAFPLLSPQAHKSLAPELNGPVSKGKLGICLVVGNQNIISRAGAEGFLKEVEGLAMLACVHKSIVDVEGIHLLEDGCHFDVLGFCAEYDEDFHDRLPASSGGWGGG